MGAIVGLMSREELDRGLELARLAGELWTIAMWRTCWTCRCSPASSKIAACGCRDAVEQLLRYTGRRALAGAIKQTGKAIEALGENGLRKVRCA